MKPTVFALRHPIATLMLVVALIGGGAVAYFKMRVDIFPALNVPKIYVFLDYMGMSPDQMEGFIVNQLELYFQYVDGVQDINTRNIQQVALTELSFFPGTDMGQAMGQVVAMSDRAMSWMPKGTLPPMIMRMDAGSVPVGYLVFESEVTSLGRLGDLAQNVIRPLSPSLDPDDPQSRHYDPLLHAPAEEAQAAAPSLPLPAVAPQRAGIRHAPAGGPAFRAVTNVPPETVVWHGDL